MPEKKLSSSALVPDVPTFVIDAAPQNMTERVGGLFSINIEGLVDDE